MSEVELILPSLHPGQKEVLSNSKRFNVLCCGRRWGKTKLAQELLLSPDDPFNGALNGFPVGYFAPTYKMLMEVWRELNLIIYDLVKNKSEQDKRIELYGGGIIDFWSLEDFNTIRGRKYKRAVIDEAAIVRYLMEAWQRVIRPTLTDMEGDAFLLSTPKGKNNEFFDIYNYEHKFKDWISWQRPTENNPFIKPEEIEAAKSQLDPLSFAQEYLASFVTQDLDAWAYCFDYDKQVGKVKPLKGHELCLSFDFNRNPITCGVFQHYDNIIHGVEQIKLKNSNIYELCDYIKVNYPGFIYLVTGDATGKASSALVQDNINYYTVIKNKLGLSNGQIRVPAINPKLLENRVLVNSVLHNVNCIFDSDKCKGLIFDFEHARVLPDGSLDKTERNDPTKQLDALDCFRYYCQTFFKHILKI